MDVALLVHAIVRQTMVLVAQLATTSGTRAPLAHLANQVFLELVQELEAQGLGRKIIADMFGMALRSYHAKVRRLSGSATDRGRSLWEVVFEYIQQREVVTRGEILRRFDRDDVMTVKGVLNDLTESGLVFKTGRGDSTAYKAARSDELGRVEPTDPLERAANVVWVAVYRQQRPTRTDLLDVLGMGEEVLDRALERLVADGRVRIVAGSGEPRYTSDQCVLSYESPAGWEAAVFDHFQAVVTTIGGKLRQGGTRAHPNDAIGGSTYAFDLWQGHPYATEVLSQLAQARERLSDLRARVDAFNAEHAPTGTGLRVSLYLGQNVVRDDEAEPASLYPPPTGD